MEIKSCICCVCSIIASETSLRCSSCSSFYHKKCLHNYLQSNYKCNICKSYDFIDYPSRNFGPKKMNENYSIRVFYAKPFECLELNAREKLRFLLKNKIIDKEVVDSNGNSLLSVACFLDHIETVKMLVGEFELNMYHCNKKQEFAIHICCKVGSIEILKYLIKVDQNIIHLLNTTGQTPLHVSILSDQATISNYLTLSMSADKLDLEDVNGETPLMLIYKKRNKAIFLNTIKEIVASGAVNSNIYK